MKNRKYNPIHFYDDYPTDADKISFLRDLVERRPIGYQKILSSSNYVEVRQWIYDYVPKLQDQIYNISTRIYWILNGLTDFPTCMRNGCDNKIGIGINVKVTAGYSSYCSKSCAAKSDLTRQRYREASIAKYGVDNPRKADIVKEKAKSTTLKHYGVEFYSQYKKRFKNSIEKHNKTQYKIKQIQKTFEAKSANESDIRQSYESFLNIQFPFKTISDREIELEIKKLKSNVVYSDKLYSPIICKYCPSIWKCESHGTMSPYDYWNYMKNDFKAFEKLYNNRIKYKGIATPDVLREGMNISKIAMKVSYLKPMLAKRLIRTYLSDSEEIFNPFNGFSGIMLGATLGCSKKYIGQDINETFVLEAKSIASDFNLNAIVKIQDVFTDVFQTHDALFCCPPYENIEKWNFDENGNCIDVDMPCDDWIDVCLNKYDCRKYLFVVDNRIEKWRSNIVEEIMNNSHFDKNSEYVVLIEH